MKGDAHERRDFGPEGHRRPARPASMKGDAHERRDPLLGGSDYVQMCMPR